MSTPIRFGSTSKDFEAYSDLLLLFQSQEDASVQPDSSYYNIFSSSFYSILNEDDFCLLSTSSSEFILSWPWKGRLLRSLGWISGMSSGIVSIKTSYVCSSSRADCSTFTILPYFSSFLTSLGVSRPMFSLNGTTFSSVFPKMWGLFSHEDLPLGVDALLEDDRLSKLYQSSISPS